MSAKKLHQKQRSLLTELKQKITKAQFNKVCKVVELEFKVAEQMYK